MIKEGYYDTECGFMARVFMVGSQVAGHYALGIVLIPGEGWKSTSWDSEDGLVAWNSDDSRNWSLLLDSWKAPPQSPTEKLEAIQAILNA